MGLKQKSLKVLWGTAAAISISAATLTATASSASAEGLFQSAEYRRDTVHLLGKWAQVLARASRDGSRKACANGGCRITRWQRFLKQARGLSKMEQLRAVNRFVNRVRYTEDRNLYGRVDYWATPKQFFARRAGDCEDYAIAKYMSLKALGWNIDHLRLVVLMDNNLGIAHAVLAVRHRGTFFILDNQIRRVINHRRIRHYRPLYSMNERNWWFHRGGGRRVRPAG